MGLWIAPLLGLGAAVAWGSSDVFAGIASRRAGVLATVLIGQILSVMLLLSVLPFADSPPTAVQLTRGAAAGVAAGSGLMVYFRGLAHGHMSVVAPVTAVISSGVPVAVGFALGERPSAVTVVGIVLAVVAIALVSVPDGTPEQHPSVPAVPVAVDRRLLATIPGRGLWEAVVAGVAFGLYLVLLDATGSGHPLWPLVASSAGTLPPIVLAALLLQRPVRPDRRALWAIMAVAVLSTGGSALFLAGTRLGLLSLVAVTASLSPAATVLLARTILHERIGRLQGVGLAAALAGVVLIAAG